MNVFKNLKNTFTFIGFSSNSFIVLWLLLFVSGHTYTQIFPVQANPQMIPPYSLKISDYGTAQSERVILNILLTDVTDANRRVILKLFIENNAGLSVQSTDVIIGANPIILDGGTPLRLTNVDLQAYFSLQNLQGITPQQYNQTLPEGSYRFCFEVYDALSGQQLSRKSCATAYLVLNDPPFLNLPNRGELIAQKEPQNIIFQWTPRHLNATNVQYEFTLAEIWDTGMNPQAAFLASRPLYQTTTFANTLLYGPAETPLLPDKTYGWRVRAVVTDGISETSVFRNDGNSEIYHFMYTGTCDAPGFLLAEGQNPTTQKILWQGTDHKQYKVQYRKKSDPDAKEEFVWFENNAYNEQSSIYNLEPGTTYEFRVGGMCKENTGFTYSQINEFTTMIAASDTPTYSCGITPEIVITNQNPLEALVVNDVFTAGDFPVTVKFVGEGNTESPGVGQAPISGNGYYSGWGYIKVPYLENTKIKVSFNGIKINSDYQLTEGIVITDYDQNWGGVDDISDELDVVSDGVDVVGDAIGDVIDTVGDVVDGITSGGEDTPNDQDINPSQDEETVTEDNPPTDEETTEDPPPTDEEITEDPPVVDPPPNDQEPEIPDQESENTNVTKIWFAGDGRLYGNGEIIEIDFNSEDLNLAFKLDDYPEETETFKWIFLHNNTDHTVNVKNNDDNLDNFGMNLKGRNGDLKLKAIYDDEEIEVIINISKEQFDLVELKGTHKNKPMRIAKSGETLYLLTDDDQKEIVYDLDLNPELGNHTFSNQDIVWYYEVPNQQTNLGQNYGNSNITRNLTQQPKINNTRVIAGYPQKKEKSIDVQWLDRNFKKHGNIFPSGFDLMPHLKELAKKLGVPVYEEEGKYANDVGFSVLIDPKYLTQIENKEDLNSRLVFKETKEKYSLVAGLKGKFEKGIPYLSLPQVKKSYLGVDFEFSLGVFFFMEGRAQGEIGHTKYTEDWIEEKEKRNRTYLKVADPSVLTLRARIGLDPKLVLKASKNMSGKVSAIGFVEAIIVEADFANETFSFPIIERGLALKFKPTINFKFFDWEYTYLVDEKVYDVKW